jgi:hypothetical protein
VRKLENCIAARLTIVQRPQLLFGTNLTL